MKRILFASVALLLLFMTDSCDMQVQTGKDYSDTLTLDIMKRPYGTADSREVWLFTLTNTQGTQVQITNYGAIITAIRLPDRSGAMGDIVLGYDSLGGYIANNPYFGAIVGRYANRIAGGTFSLDGKRYTLARNNGNNALHGGLKGFDKVVWDAEPFTDSASHVGVVMKYLSKDGEEGFPGNLAVKVTYTLNELNELITVIEAETDKATPVNLCNHTYFNLNGANADVLNHFLTLSSERYTAINGELIPTGEMAAVRGNSMDFNHTEKIGARIARIPGGYDHNYVLNKQSGARALELAARLFDPSTGRQVDILTTQPGIQFYSGNFLDGSITGKGGKVYGKHFGLCLETQHFPDSPNQPSFPNTILRPGEQFKETTVYRFSVVK